MRLLQFRLRTLMLAVLCAAIAMGWWANRRHRWKSAIRQVELNEGRVGGFPGFSEHAGDVREVYFRTPKLPFHDRRFELRPKLDLGPIREFRYLQELSLRWRSIKKDSLRALRSNELSSLDMICADVSDDDLSYVGRFRMLTRLHVAGNPLGDRGVGCLVHLSRLELLNISGTQISDKAMFSIARLSSLKQLDISDTSVADVGDLPFPQLWNLVLRRTQISDKAMLSVAQLPSLDTLDISDTSVTDVGVGYLRECRSLAFIACKGTPITEAGVRELSLIPSLTWIDCDAEVMSDDVLALFEKKEAALAAAIESE